MANRKILLLLATLNLAAMLANGEVQLITKPEPGQEYVFLQTSAAGSRPVERKEKPSANERVFETAHKLPPSLTFALNQAQAEEGEIPTEPKGPVKTSKVAKPKREAMPADAPVPAPAGAIKLDVQALLAKYKTELKTSTTTTTAKPGTIQKARSTRKPRANPINGNKRSKKEALDETVIATTSSSVLTTSAAGLKPIERDDDIPLVASGSEKQRSRIQIKKGPNGQEYEYEYVYYYYDDDDEKNSSKPSNAHDGPARNEIAPQSPSRGGSSKTATPEPATNEVLPTSRGRTRGRQLEDEDVADERLPANTRFPPRSRNLNTTPTSVDEPVEEVKPRGRGRGRPEAAASSAESNSDSVSDETQGSRGRTRANVRRPSLELVDSASFNTHTSSGEPPNGSGPTFPADLPAGPVRFLGATPNERMDLPDKKESASSAETVAPAAPADEATTVMSAMDKVALDLYAILQGTQRLSGEETEGNTELNTEADAETTTLEATTEVPTTEAATTTTTTTTTTTPAPSTAAPESVFGRGKYRTRPAIGGRKPVSTTTTTEAPGGASDGKPKNRFNRPSFGTRPRARPAATPTEGEPEQKEVKEDAKPLSAGRTRTRFGAARTKATTVAPAEGTAESKAPSTSKPSLRPRPTFNLRGRTRPTPAPEGESAATEEGQEPSTTARTRPKLNASNVRPLRPGPRINLTGGRGRLGASTPASDVPAEPAPVVEEDQEKVHPEEGETKEAEVTPAPDTNPLSRLRNRQRTPLQVRPAAPKAAASAPVQVRRANPLISRRKPIGEASTTEGASPAEAAHSAATEAPSDAEEASTDAAASSTTSTTEEPKGLNKLLAGRRRFALRQPGTVAA